MTRPPSEATEHTPRGAAAGEAGRLPSGPRAGARRGVP
jgi:hypothetical protein